MKEKMIILENVKKSFKLTHEKETTIFESFLNKIKGKNTNEELKVIDNISLDVKKGEMFGIIGKNGVGKTTLLRLMAGIYKPNSGKIIINGTTVPLLGLGMGFNGESTARKNIILYGKLLGFSHKEISNKTDQILKFAELEKFAETKLKNFSTGMAARLSFSTAIQVDPDILFVDEILSVGDVAFRQKSFDKFLEFRKRKKTIIFVSHNLEAIKKCDRVMFLDKGKINCIGTPEEVSQAYLASFD